jgi:hypothetical protein
LTGEELTLAWEVVDADELVLKTNGNPETILSTEHTSERITKPSVDTTYVLEAHNIYGEVTDSLEVKVLIPTPTLVPTPFVRKFIANPSVITVGTPVVVEWDVEGADVVSVQPVGGNLPPIQSVSQSPQQNTTYVLNAAKGSSSIQPIAIQVYVTPAPTATPVPDAPEIVFFEADPAELIQGKATPTDDEKAVNLKWLVRGTVTNVELNGGPDIGVFSNLDPEGTLPVSLSKDTVFVLTAFNQDKTSSKTVQVQVLEATPTPVPPTPPPTPLPLPKILNFAITSPGSPQVIKVSSTEYQVQVNTAVTFEWQADAAATGGTELSLAGQVIGSGSNNGIAKDIKITASGSYVVVAKNAEGKASSPAVINVTVIDQLPPNPPYNLTATEDQTNKSVKLDWKWDNDPSRSPATGYRVYRADVGGSFSQIAEISGASTKTFTDTNVAPNTCNKIYYVVAIYVDLQGNMKESAVSANSWYTSPGPCP